MTSTAAADIGSVIRLRMVSPDIRRYHPHRDCVVNICSVISAAVGRECVDSGARGASLPAGR
jgi:hypothetical protein